MSPRGTQLAFEFAWPPVPGQEDFLIGPSNAEAAAWLEPGRRWPAPALVLHGPAGSGRTHLARLWCAVAQGVVLAPAALKVVGLPERVGGARAVALDDADGGDGADGAVGHEERERALLHLYNWLAEARGRLLVVGSAPPAAWGIGLADLRSRLLAAPAVAIAAPDEGLLAALLVKRLADCKLHPSAEIVTYLVERMERSFAAIHRLVRALDRATMKRPLTLPVAREVLAALAAEG